MMKDLYQKYLDNLVEGHDLIKKNLFSNADSKGALLRQIRENSHRTYQLRTENDRLLNELIYSRKPEELTEQDVEELLEFADKLYTFLQQNDIGTSYLIHQLIYDYAVLKDDADLRLRQTYLMGTNLYYLNLQMNELGINLFGPKVTELFRAGADLFPQYEQIESQETRGYIVRCLTNLWLADESTSCKHQPGVPADKLSTYYAFREYFHRMLPLYTSSHYSTLPSNFPRDRAVYNLHYNRCQYFQDLQVELPLDVKQELMESAQYIHDHQKEFIQYDNPIQSGQVEYIYAINKCRMGLMTLAELTEMLIQLAESADPDDFSVNGITLNLQIPLYLEYTYHIMTEEERKPYLSKLTAIAQTTNDYLLRAPHNEFTNVVTRAVGESIRYRVHYGKPLQHQIFSALLFCHPPTYIHVHIVASLSQKLLMHMAATTPEKLIGLYGMTDPAEIRAQAHTLGQRIYLCALYHDIGKLMLLDYISVYGRMLLDEEFEAIKLHPQIGSLLLAHLDTPELSVVTLHHHRFFNGQGGYPTDCAPCPKQYKPLVDIITVCDSIEAATDDIGRCYSIAKSFDQIINELRQESGTRYSPDVIALFDDEEFFRSVERDLLQERKDSYFEIYGNESMDHTA